MDLGLNRIPQTSSFVPAKGLRLSHPASLSLPSLSFLTRGKSEIIHSAQGCWLMDRSPLLVIPWSGWPTAGVQLAPAIRMWKFLVCPGFAFDFVGGTLGLFS